MNYVALSMLSSICIMTNHGTHYDDDDDDDVDVDVDDDNDSDNDDDLPFHPYVSCELQVFPNHKELTNMLACLSKCFLMLHFTPFTHLVGRSEEF